jgi:hypothetical protein
MVISNTIEQITIDLTNDIKVALERKAKGQDIKIFIQTLVNKQAMRPSLEEELAPVRQEFRESGMSENELDNFLNSVRKTYLKEKTGKS